MKSNGRHAALHVGFVVALLCAATVLTWAQTAPPLGLSGQFGAIAGSGVTGAAGGGVVVSGDVGSSPTATISNFPPSSTVPPWIVHLTNDGVAQQAHADAIAAYGNLAGQTPATPLPAQLSGVTLTSGIYSFETVADLASNGTLTLNGSGVFVFQVPSALTANVGSMITGTADACNVFWQVGTSATLNGSAFWGTVVADASITLGSGANLVGRALAGNGATGAVTMSGSGGNTIGGCSSQPSTPCPAIALTPATLPPGKVGEAYSQQITASGGTGSYTFLVSSGTLPLGLTLSPTGLLAGTPTSAGSATVTIAGTDQNGCPGQTSYTIVITTATPEQCPPIVVAPPTLPPSMAGVPTSQQLTASGGTGPYTFVVSSGTLPAGLTLSPTGLLAGTPTTAGSALVTILGTDQNGCPGQTSYTIVITTATPEQCPPIVVAPATLPPGKVGDAYSRQITASGGTGPYTFVVSTGTLPAGLTLSPTGLLSGTPTAASSSAVVIVGTDQNGCPGQTSYTITIAQAVPTLPQVFMLFLIAALTATGYLRLRRRARAN
ncbi:MAG: putative Ig domain-containing protein [Vicinamibacterales bacterium]